MSFMISLATSKTAPALMEGNRTERVGFEALKAMDIDERIMEAFRGLSERRTQARQEIAQSLIKLGRRGVTFSADELLRRLRRANSRIGRATVYRSIEKLVRMKVLDRIEFADGSRSFCLCEGQNNHHLACTRCHRVIELHCCLEKGQIDEIGRREDFRIDDHSLILFGLCRKCQHEG
jgi:Fur family ferric uptake transcriptional regulator